MGFHVDHLTVRYGRALALADVSVRFDSGALGLLGPNGAGKSSLLRTLLGFIAPAGGTVQVLGNALDVMRICYAAASATIPRTTCCSRA